MTDKKFLDVPLGIKNYIDSSIAWEYKIIPMNLENESITFYVDEKAYYPGLKNELETIFGKKVAFNKVDQHLVENTLLKFYQKITNGVENNKSINWQDDDFIDNLIQEAVHLNSSDIHIERYEFSCRIRMRVDGKLISRHIVIEKEYPTIINKIKIKANLDISEKRLPQDGRINFAVENKQIDIRVSSLPSLFGEKIVLRLLNKETTQINLKSLGLSNEQYDEYIKGISRPHGIILISGPTGSGKTTTLYATLKMLNRENVNVLTIEDPIEYTLEGINQVQLKESIGLTFASALRTFLRQDPDIIMLGEIRDGETAQMAIRAALTGHLVLSTIHTNSALGTISRLRDMGVPAFLIASTLNISVAQRLVRLLCNDCKKKTVLEQMPQFSYVKHKIKAREIYIAVGCKNCLYTGYKGRKAIYEIINVINETEKLIREDNYSQLEEMKFEKLSDVALKLLENGSTSLDEVFQFLL